MASHLCPPLKEVELRSKSCKEEEGINEFLITNYKLIILRLGSEFIANYHFFIDKI